MRKAATAGLGLLAGLLAGALPAQAEKITIATVNNSDMIIMQKLAPRWEAASGHELEWVVLEENVLRQRVTTDIATQGGQFDIITIGAYETPIWGKQGWLVPLDDFGDDYDYEDIFKGVRNGLSANGTLYAVPFYAESSFTFYRKDLFEDARLNMPTKDPVPYTGIQFVAIPEFQGIGTQVGQSVAAALSGQMTVEKALETAQRATVRTMKQAGYPK